MRYGFLNPITRCFFPYGPNIAQRYKSRNLIGAIKGKIYIQRVPAVPEGGYLNSGAERESIERENLNNGG